MFSQIGFIFLICAYFANFFIIGSYKINSDFIREKFFYFLIYFIFISTLISFFSLMGNYIISDFSNYNVFQNSHSSKPLIYKITGTWGNHEGSMLLWLLIMSAYTLLFSFNNARCAYDCPSNAIKSPWVESKAISS